MMYLVKHMDNFPFTITLYIFILCYCKSRNWTIWTLLLSNIFHMQ